MSLKITTMRYLRNNCYHLVQEVLKSLETFLIYSLFSTNRGQQIQELIYRFETLGIGLKKIQTKPLLDNLLKKTAPHHT